MSQNDNASYTPRPSSQGALVPVSSAVGDPHVDTVDRFQALEPGHYWVAQKDAKHVVAGDTHLLMEIVEFEDKVHSVVVRSHPRTGTGQFKMMIGDFLDVFIPDPVGEAVRQREQQAVMSEVTNLQNELMQTQMSPQLLLEAASEKIEEGMEKLQRDRDRAANERETKTSNRDKDLAKVHRRAARRAEAKGNPLVAPKIVMASEVGSLISAGINEQGINEFSLMAERQAVIAQAQGDWLQEKTKEISKTLEKLSPYIAERSAVAIARTAGAVKLAERIGRGIQSLDLYVGKGVTVYDIKSGPDAPASEPLTLVQGKRFAEEELAVWADVDATFDFRDRETFFKALAEDDGLLNQLLPYPRCVVSMAMTRRAKDYGDDLKAALADYNGANARFFLLVRNGSNVHAVYSDSPSHEFVPNLFPTRDDLDAPFRGRDGERISIRDVEFGESARRFDDMDVVYRRLLILLCGLDHRLGLLGRFYPEQEQMRFMSLDFQAQYMRFIADQDDAHWMLGDELPDLADWFATKNNMLQSGSRVFVLGNSIGAQKACPTLERSSSSLHSASREFEHPFLAHKETGRLAVTLPLRSYRGERDTATCFLTGTENRLFDGAWWLCVDAVGLDEVRRYRHSRVYRAMGIGYLRLFRRVEAYLAGEAALEASAREYLLGAAVEFGGMTRQQASDALDGAVRNWRAARRGAALPGAEDKAGLNEVLDLMVPEGYLPAAVDAMLSVYLEGCGTAPLLLTRSGKSKLVLYVVASEEDRSPYPDVLTWGWVKRITLDVGKRKLKEAGSTLVWLKTVLPASEVELRRWPGLDAWLNAKDEPISLRRYSQLLPLLRGSAEWDSTLRAGPGAGIPDDLFARLYESMDQADWRQADRSNRTVNFIVTIPIAAYSEDGRTLKMTYMEAYAASVLCTYGTAAQAARTRAQFGRSPSQKSKLSAAPKWLMATVVAEKLYAHDAAGHTGLNEPDYAPAWRKHHVKVNRKLGDISFFGVNRKKTKGDGGPYLSQMDTLLSHDRALAQLTGSAPVFLSREFYRRLDEKVTHLKRWGSGTRDESDAERDLRLKAELKNVRSARYVHAFKVALSPLVWSEKSGRPCANALFVAPLRGTR
jgi:hypothetical protein